MKELIRAVEAARAIWPKKTWTRATSEELYAKLFPVVQAIRRGAAWDLFQHFAEDMEALENDFLARKSFDNHNLETPLALALAEAMVYGEQLERRALPGPSGFVVYSVPK